MHLPQLSFALLLVLVCLVAVFVDTTEAGRKRGKKSKNGAGAACKYYRKGEDGPCTPETNMKQVTFQLKRGDPETCAPTQTADVACDDLSQSKRKGRKVKGCRYDRKGSSWSECDETTGVKTRVMNLRTGSSAECPATRTKTKPCGASKKSKRQRGARSRKGCVYSKQPWSACDMDTKTKQREMNLVQGEPSLCLPRKIVTKKCKKACRYIKGEWSPCNPNTNLSYRTMTPKRSGIEQCASKIQTKPCRRRAELTAPKSNKCRYHLSKWSPCDPRSNTMTQLMTLKSGDPNVCQRTKKLTRKCKIACKFQRGQWSECDEKTLLITRVDNLVKGDSRQCDSTRQITKKCKKNCKYSLGDWGECDPITNERQRIKKLIEGDKEKCAEEDVVSKPCNRKDGGERCFFGSWGDFGPCNNGVMTKHRPVVQGGVNCERKAVITKACTKKQ